MSVCHHPARHVTLLTHLGNSQPPVSCHRSTALQSLKTSIYTLPPAAIPCLATSPKITSGCATCPVSRAVGVRSDRVSEWLGWFTSLPTLLKRCQEAVFQRPLPLRLTPPDTVKRPVLKPYVHWQILTYTWQGQVFSVFRSLPFLWEPWKIQAALMAAVHTESVVLVP